MIDGRSRLMIALHVGLDEVRVVLHHLEIGVTEQIFESDHLAAVAEVFGGEGVAKAMRMDVGDAGAIAETLNEPTQGVAGEGALIADGEEKIIGCAAANALVENLPEQLRGAHAEVNNAELVAFAVRDDDRTLGETEMLDSDVAQFLRAQAGVEQDEENEPITPGGVTLGSGIGGRPARRAVAGVEQGGNLSVRERGDAGRGLDAGPIDGADKIGFDPAGFDEPGVQRGEVGVDVAPRLGAERTGGARGDAGRGIDAIAQLVEKSDPVIAGEIGDEGIVAEVAQDVLAGNDVI